MLLFVTETNDKTQSDDYLRSLFYSGFFDNDGRKYVQLKFVHMDGKQNYRSKRVEKEIKSSYRQYSSQNKHLIYVFDVDSVSRKDNDLNNEIIRYCADFSISNDIIWFFKDIECNFLGHPVNGHSKREEAIRFYGNPSIQTTTKKMIQEWTKSFSFKKSPESNVIAILSKYLKLNGRIADEVRQAILKNASI